jgi:hypothetical protein
LIANGSVVLAGFILTLMALKAMRAVVATPVQLANTTTNPAVGRRVDIHFRKSSFPLP